MLRHTVWTILTHQSKLPSHIVYPGLSHCKRRERERGGGREGKREGGREERKGGRESGKVSERVFIS